MPVNSITGVLRQLRLPNCSATAVVNGYTVEEQMKLIASRRRGRQRGNAEKDCDRDKPVVGFGHSVLSVDTLKKSVGSVRARLRLGTLPTSYVTNDEAM